MLCSHICLISASVSKLAMQVIAIVRKMWYFLAYYAGISAIRNHCIAVISPDIFQKIYSTTVRHLFTTTDQMHVAFFVKTCHCSISIFLGQVEDIQFICGIPNLLALTESVYEGGGLHTQTLELAAWTTMQIIFNWIFKKLHQGSYLFEHIQFQDFPVQSCRKL